MDLREIIKKGQTLFMESVTKLEITQFENIRDGKVTLSGEVINVNLTNNVSFRIDPGHPQYMTWLKKIGVGYTIIISAASAGMKANTSTWTRKSTSGEDIPETRTYFNIVGVEVLDIIPPEIDERFAALPDVGVEITKTIRKGGDYAGAGTGKSGESTLNTSALSSSEGPTL